MRWLEPDDEDGEIWPPKLLIGPITTGILSILSLCWFISVGIWFWAIDIVPVAGIFDCNEFVIWFWLFDAEDDIDDDCEHLKHFGNHVCCLTYLWYSRRI